MKAVIAEHEAMQLEEEGLLPRKTVLKRKAARLKSKVSAPAWKARNLLHELMHGNASIRREGRGWAIVVDSDPWDE